MERALPSVPGGNNRAPREAPASVVCVGELLWSNDALRPTHQGPQTPSSSFHMENYHVGTRETWHMFKFLLLLWKERIVVP